MSNINKVIFGDRTLIDLTTDTIERSCVVAGKTFHLPSGEIQTGTLEQYDGSLV